MDLLQTIFSNNRLVEEAVEQAAPVLMRLAGKLSGRLGSGGRIVCLGGNSSVPGEYGMADRFVCPEPGEEEYDVTVKDAVIAVDGDFASSLAEQMRSFRRRGMLTACITADAASPVASASEIAVCVAVEPEMESRSLKAGMAQQMALDALLTLVLAPLHAAMTGDDASAGDGPLAKAAATLMKEIPALDMESALELIRRHGTVRKAAKAYKANVQAEL